jgi:hypothetical protein
VAEGLFLIQRGMCQVVVSEEDTAGAHCARPTDDPDFGGVLSESSSDAGGGGEVGGVTPGWRRCMDCPRMTLCAAGPINGLCCTHYVVNCA